MKLSPTPDRRATCKAKNIDEGKVFKKGSAVVWRCRNCGYLHEGPEAPDVCPACIHEQSHFEVLGENW